MYQIRNMIDTPHRNPTIADYITSAYRNDLTENEKYQIYDKTNDTIGYYIVLYILFMNKGIVRPIHLDQRTFQTGTWRPKKIESSKTNGPAPTNPKTHPK